MRAMAVVLALIASLALAEVAGTASVIDGDTIEVHGQRIRLHGIDAPQINQTCWDDRGEFPCGRRAKHILWISTKDREVTCQPRDNDRYGRLVAVCFVDGRDLGQTMVESGWALAYQRYSPDYVNAETEAKRLQKGLWQWQFTRPCKWRAMMRQPLRDPDEFQCQ